MDIQKRKKVWELAVVSLFLTIITGYAMDLGVPRPAKAEMLYAGQRQVVIGVHQAILSQVTPAGRFSSSQT